MRTDRLAVAMLLAAAGGLGAQAPPSGVATGPLIELSEAGKRVRVLFRIWLDNAWTIDRNQRDCPDGQADVELGSQQPVIDPRRPAAPKIPTEYLEWVLPKLSDLPVNRGKGHLETMTPMAYAAALVTT